MTRERERLLGNVVVRRRRRRTETVRVTRRGGGFAFRPRPWMIPVAFAVVIGIGSFLLSLPIASESREWTNGLDALFTSASAVCVTGLSRFDTADHYSAFGEFVIAVLIQAGGLGVTMYAGLMVLLVGGRIGLRGREFFGMELMGVEERDVLRLLRRVMMFTVVVEGSTFLLLLPWFLTIDDALGASWRSLFHAISAFNNAGFDLMGGGIGFTEQVDDPYPIFVMGVSAFLGSLSFVTVFDLRHRPRRWTLDTRLVMIGMVGLLFVGIAVFVLAETLEGRPLEGLNPIEVFVNSFFLSVNRTTGMATIDMSAISDSTTAVLLVLMFIGGASTSTAGGIKMGAFMVSMVVVASGLSGRHSAQAFGRTIPQAIVLRAMTITIVGFVLHSAGAWLIGLTDDHVEFLPLLFEVMSALANVGWSQDVTWGLSHAGATILVVLMFVGRLGPLFVALTIPDRPQERYQYAEGVVRIG